VRGPGGEPLLSDLHIPLLGRHQRDNATTAIAILYELRGQGVSIPDESLRTGLASARWPGRFEVLQQYPALVVDSAHNENSAQKLRAALADYFPRPPRRQLAVIFGASSDKDIIGMLKTFLEAETATGYRPADKVIVTKSGHPRSAEPAQLADMVRNVNASCPISVHTNLNSALTEALAWAEPDDLICITGSIFVVAQARRAWAARHPDTFAPDDWVFEDETAGAPVPD
jgi:dihydrofolate synthase/folylpolyglutamate synthase